MRDDERKEKKVNPNAFHRVKLNVTLELILQFENQINSHAELVRKSQTLNTTN